VNSYNIKKIQNASLNIKLINLYYSSILLGLFIYILVWTPRLTIDMAPIINQISKPNPIHSNKTIIQFTNDTIAQNSNFSYASSIANLKLLFAKIDSIDSNIETKNYLKVLLLSDYVYGIFSFQFLGSEIGLSNHTISISGWDSLPLKTCYDKGNKNETPVWCMDRTSFFNRLVDSLLGLPTETVSIKGVHSFSLVKLNSGKYIFDPSDPLVVLNKRTQKLIPYEQLTRNNLMEIEAIRTKRKLGSGGFLISTKFWTNLTKEVTLISDSIDILLEDYYLNNKSKLSKLSKDCEVETYNFNGTIYPTMSLTDGYILKPSDLINPSEMSSNHFKKFYLGINCQ
jgi:hypothetical protein